MILKVLAQFSKVSVQGIIIQVFKRQEALFNKTKHKKEKYTDDLLTTINTKKRND